MTIDFLASCVRLQHLGEADVLAGDDAPASGVLYLHVPAGRTAPVDSFAAHITSTVGLIELAAYESRLQLWRDVARQRQPVHDPEQDVFGPDSELRAVQQAIAGIYAGQPEAMHTLAELVEAAGGDPATALCDLDAFRAMVTA